jgi:acyl-coenzyme A synthetase/AMP-(fatty) acid ligase
MHIHGQELPEPFGVIISVIKKRTAFQAFTGDGALRDEVGYYRIGRVDDVVIVSGHNLGTAPIEDAINEHPAVAESAIVGFPHKRECIIWLCYSKRNRRVSR